MRYESLGEKTVGNQGMEKNAEATIGWAAVKEFHSSFPYYSN